MRFAWLTQEADKYKKKKEEAKASKSV